MAWTTTICSVLAVLFSHCEQTASEAIEMTRPPDIPTERLERPRPEQERPSRDRQNAALRHADVIKLAKTRAKKELGASFDEYELKAVLFDPTARMWSVTFNPKVPRRPATACVIVFVRDDTQETEIVRCA